MQAKLVGTRNLSMSHGTNKNGKLLLQKSQINEFQRFFSITLILAPDANSTNDL